MRLFKKNRKRTYKKRTGYKSLMISPEAHAKISKMADKSGTSMIDTVDRLVKV